MSDVILSWSKIKKCSFGGTRRKILIPEQFQKPLKLFHGITLEGQIKIPSMQGSVTQKQRLDDKKGAQREETSWVQEAAKQSFLLLLLLLLPCLLSLEEVKGVDRLCSFNYLSLVNVTFLISVLNLNFVAPQ